jgi:hypothetical protein
MRFVPGKAETQSGNYLMEIIAQTSDSPEGKRPVIPPAPRRQSRSKLHAFINTSTTGIKTIPCFTPAQ